LEFVTPTGEIVHTPAVPRHAAGPELMQLLIGAEGTLGIITAAVVKIRKLPAKRVFGVFTFPDLGTGLEAGRQVYVSGLRPPVGRYYDEHAASHSLARAIEYELHAPTFLLMFDGEYPALVDCEAQVAFDLMRQLGGTEHDAKLGELWWDRRYVFYYPPYAPELPSIWGTVDVVADFAHIEAVYHATTQAIRDAVPEKWNLSLTTHFSHWYEWGSMIYPRMKIPTGPSDLAEAKALHDAAFKAGIDAAMAAGAVLNDHHGVGMRLAGFMPEQYGAGMESLRAIKRALDPQNILCPGKLSL
jgi:alkyldihydroxyacetonephosphate synthase